MDALWSPAATCFHTEPQAVPHTNGMKISCGKAHILGPGSAWNFRFASLRQTFTTYDEKTWTCFQLFLSQAASRFAEIPARVLWPTAARSAADYRYPGTHCSLTAKRLQKTDCSSGEERCHRGRELVGPSQCRPSPARLYRKSRYADFATDRKGTDDQEYRLASFRAPVCLLVSR